MRGKIDGEENARLGGKKIQGGHKKFKGKKDKSEEKGKKVIKSPSNSNENTIFFLQYDNPAMKNKGKGQNEKVRNEYITYNDKNLSISIHIQA